MNEKMKMSKLLSIETKWGVKKVSKYEKKVFKQPNKAKAISGKFINISQKNLSNLIKIKVIKSGTR